MLVLSVFAVGGVVRPVLIDNRDLAISGIVLLGSLAVVCGSC